MNDDPRRPFADWTTEVLKELEECLYDAEVAGDDTWFERDQVLWELEHRLTKVAANTAVTLHANGVNYTHGSEVP